MTKYNTAQTPEQQEKHYQQEVFYSSISGPYKMANTEIHRSFLLLFIEQGGGWLYVNGTKQAIAPLQVRLIAPGQWYKWDLDPDAKVHQLVLGTTVFQKSVTHFPERPFRHVDFIQFESANFLRLLAEVTMIRRELSVQPVMPHVILLRCNVLAHLLTGLAEAAFHNRHRIRNTPLICRFQQLVEEKFSEQKSLSFYARALSITPNYLSILCKRTLKVPALTFIQNRLLLEAQSLLQVSGRSVKEIAFELGFNELSYFSAFFKSKTGQSPRQYKNAFFSKMPAAHPRIPPLSGTTPVNNDIY